MEEARTNDSDVFGQSSWVGVPDSQYQAAWLCREGMDTAWFRLSFRLPAAARLKLSISASSRYRLWVNDRHAVFGPCKGDRWRYFFETVDLTSYLLEGENQIQPKVVAYLEQSDSFITMIPGIGPVLGAVILSEVGDISRFEDGKKLVAYAVIDAAVSQSGSFEGTQMHIP